MIENKTYTKKELAEVMNKSTTKNQECYDKNGNFLGWFSRSVAAVAIVFCKDSHGEMRVLASERGKEAADYQGYWNCVCGYVDFNETVMEAAQREVYEECGLKLDKKYFQFAGYNDNPSENRQNITFRFAVVIKDKTIGDFTFSKKHNEGKEVGEIKWLKLTDIGNYKWAFGHNQIIKDICKTFCLFDF